MKPCVFFSGLPFLFKTLECKKPSVAVGQHGFLCEEHRKFEDHSLVMRKVVTPKAVVDFEQQQIENILALEKREIAKGVRRSVRFGSKEPEFIHYLEHCND